MGRVARRRICDDTAAEPLLHDPVEPTCRWSGGTSEKSPKLFSFYPDIAGMNRHPPALNVGGHDAQGGLAHSIMSFSVLINLQFASGFDFKLKRGQYLGPGSYGLPPAADATGTDQGPGPTGPEPEAQAGAPLRAWRSAPGPGPRAPEAWRSRRVDICVH